ERVAKAQRDRRVDDGRVEPHLDVEARPRVRVALDDVEAREKSRAVKRAGDLAGAAADAVDELALSDDRRDLVAVRFVARTDDVVEVERFAGQDHVTVELR